MRKPSLAVIALIAFISMGALTSQVNTYINGNVLTADQLNSEFGNIYSTVNNLNEDNLTALTQIEPTKLDPTLSGEGLDRQVDGSLDVNVDGVTTKIIAGEVVIDDLPGSALATGAVSSTEILDNTITQVDRAVKTAGTPATLGNVALSADTGAAELVFTTASTGDLVNNSVTITTQGGPVLISMQAGTSSTNTYIECEELTTDPCTLEVDKGGGTLIKVPFYTQAGKYRLPPAAFNFIDVPGAGTYTYKIKYDVGSATALRILNVRLMAHEL